MHDPDPRQANQAAPEVPSPEPPDEAHDPFGGLDLRALDEPNAEAD